MERTKMYSSSRWRNLTYLCGPAKLPLFMGGGIDPRMETRINWGGPIATVPCLHQGNVYIKGKLLVWKVQKCIPLNRCKNPNYLCGLGTTSSHGVRYRAEYENLRKLGWTYCHGTVFARKKYSYRKETTGRERPKMYSTNRYRTPLTFVVRQTSPFHGGGIGLRTETCINWGGPIATVPCLQHRNIYMWQS